MKDIVRTLFNSKVGHVSPSGRVGDFENSHPGPPGLSPLGLPPLARAVFASPGPWWGGLGPWRALSRSARSADCSRRERVVRSALATGAGAIRSSISAFVRESRPTRRWLLGRPGPAGVGGRDLSLVVDCFADISSASSARLAARISLLRPIFSLDPEQSLRWRPPPVAIGPPGTGGKRLSEERGAGYTWQTVS